MDKTTERIPRLSKSLAGLPGERKGPPLIWVLGLGLGIIWVTATGLAAGVAINAKYGLHGTTDRTTEAPVTAQISYSTILGQAPDAESSAFFYAWGGAHASILGVVPISSATGNRAPKLRY